MMFPDFEREGKFRQLRDRMDPETDSLWERIRRGFDRRKKRIARYVKNLPARDRIALYSMAAVSSLAAFVYVAAVHFWPEFYLAATPPPVDPTLPPAPTADWTVLTLSSLAMAVSGGICGFSIYRIAKISKKKITASLEKRFRAYILARILIDSDMRKNIRKFESNLQKQKQDLDRCEQQIQEKKNEVWAAMKEGRDADARLAAESKLNMEEELYKPLKKSVEKEENQLNEMRLEMEKYGAETKRITHEFQAVQTRKKIAELENSMSGWKKRNEQILEDLQSENESIHPESVLRKEGMVAEILEKKARVDMELERLREEMNRERQGRSSARPDDGKPE